jgi:hypothetical protein
MLELEGNGGVVDTGGLSEGIEGGGGYAGGHAMLKG